MRRDDVNEAILWIQSKCEDSRSVWITDWHGFQLLKTERPEVAAIIETALIHGRGKCWDEHG